MAADESGVKIMKNSGSFWLESRMAKMRMLLVGVATLGVAASASASAATFDQGFETDTSGWFTSSGGGDYGTINRVASGTNSINAYQGGFFALVNDNTPNGATAIDTSGPFTRFGGYSSTFPGTYTASIAVYLDPSWSTGSGFDYSVSSSNSSGGFLRDFVFHASNDSGALLVGASNNSSDALPDPGLTNPPDYAVKTAGWYIFQQKFYDNGGQLAVDMNLYDTSSALLFSQTLSDSADTIPGVVGGNHYGWFTLVNVGTNGLAIDSSNLSATPLPAALPLFSSGLGLMGLLGWRKRRKHVTAIATA